MSRRPWSCRTAARHRTAAPDGLRGVAPGIVIAAVCLTTAILGGRAEWKRLDTANFVIVGNVGASDLRDAGFRFEAFRETLRRLFSQHATGTAVPTIVIVFASDRDFTPYKTVYKGKPVALTGLYVQGPDINHIALVNATDDNATRVIFHEYTHEVLSNEFGDAPVWFAEGIAEYYSTFQIQADGRRALIGRPIPSHVQRLRDAALLPIETLVTVQHDSPLYNEEERRSIFYAESWALVHFLLADPARRAQLGKFLAAVFEGAAPLEAWGRVFGNAVEAALRRYLQQPSFGYMQYDFREKVATLETTAVPLKDADVSAFLAGILLCQRRYDEASERLAAAIKLDPAHQHAAVMLGYLDIARNQYDSAARRFAGLRDVEDWLVAYEAGSGISKTLEERPEGPARPEEVLAARRMFDQVRRQHGEVANALARMASIELRTTEGPSADSLQAIERARALAPGRDDYAFLHAQALAEKGDFAAARSVLGPLLAAGHRRDVRDSARSLMEYIVQMENLTRTRATDLAASPGTTHPVFRTLETGEQRLEGKLERIECPPTGEVSFQLRTPDGLVTLRAERMTQVEFITYRDDLKGNVMCGPLKEPMPVFVTWRGDTAAGKKEVIAIEFLPKPKPPL